VEGDRLGNGHRGAAEGGLSRRYEAGKGGRVLGRALWSSGRGGVSSARLSTTLFPSLFDLPTLDSTHRLRSQFVRILDDETLYNAGTARRVVRGSRREERQLLSLSFFTASSLSLSAAHSPRRHSTTKADSDTRTLAYLPPSPSPDACISTTSFALFSPSLVFFRSASLQEAVEALETVLRTSSSRLSVFPTSQHRKSTENCCLFTNTSRVVPKSSERSLDLVRLSLDGSGRLLNTRLRVSSELLSSSLSVKSLLLGLLRGVGGELRRGERDKGVSVGSGGL
jgi:hypothetical protein